jgi:hypothetical protein
MPLRPLSVLTMPSTWPGSHYSADSPGSTARFERHELGRVHPDRGTLTSALRPRAEVPAARKGGSKTSDQAARERRRRGGRYRVAP